jgi:hypothetical protein
MNSTLVLVSSNRDPEPETLQTLVAFQKAGAKLLKEMGSADVAYARNRALSFACDVLRDYPELQTVLMMDDDMAVYVHTAQQLIDRSRQLERAVSGAYATKTARLAGCRWKAKPGLWLVGLGCVAIPRALLLDLEERSASFESAGRFMTEFTWACAEDGGWVAEDYRLSMQLGGVHMEPVGLGHVKKGVLWPDDETLAALAKGEVLE